MVNHKHVKVDKIEVIQEGMLMSFNITSQNEIIKVLTCYAPSSGDDPEFFIKCKEILDNSTEKHGILIGDYNTTLDPHLDRCNYKHDNHVKSRLVINSWIEASEMLDFFRLTNGNIQQWTYRVKETHNKTLKSRLDYVLGSPSLCYAISDINHIFHEFDISDHASTYFSIDFLPQSQGPGVFRAHPSLLKNKEYKNLIQNIIIYTMVEDIDDKQCSDYAEWIGILAVKEHLEQEISYLNYMEEAHQWKVKDKILEIESKLLSIRDLLPTTDQILAHKRITDDRLLLELVLSHMRDATQKFYIRLQRDRKSKKKVIKKIK